MLELMLATDKNLAFPSFEKTGAFMSSGAFGGAERAARSLAASKAGLPSMLGNMGMRSGAGIGALGGLALGALNPGKDEEGNERGIIGGAMRGAVRGGIAGGAIGGLTRHVAAPHIQQQLPAARAELNKTAEVQAPKEEMKVSSTGIKVPVLAIRG